MLNDEVSHKGKQGKTVINRCIQQEWMTNFEWLSFLKGEKRKKTVMNGPISLDKPKDEPWKTKIIING